MKIKITGLCLLLTTLTYAQAPQLMWQSFFNGSLSGKDIANAVVTDVAGNVYVTGRSYQTANGGNFTTVKYNSNGEEQWVDHFNGTSTNGTNRGVKLILDKWENLYAVGTVSSNQGDIAMVKYNSAGVLWSKSYEPYWFGSATDFGVDISADTLGNIYAAGQITSLDGNLYDLYVLKCDSNGNKIYEDNYSSASGDDYTGGIAVTPAGNVFALTNSFNFFGSATYDITTINYLQDGAHNWFSSYNGSGDGTDYGISIKADAQNNQYVCGTSDEGVTNDMVMMKQNLYGTRLWTNTYNGTANGNDTAITTALLPNGFVAVTGRCRELVNGITTPAMVTMVIDSGTIVWTNKYYGTDNAGALPSQMITDEAGNIYVCGHEILNGGTKNGCIVKYDLTGNQLWAVSFDGGVNLDDAFTSLSLDKNGNIIATGQSFTSTTNSNYVIVKYQDIATGMTASIIPVTNQILLYPNPVVSGENIHLQTTLSLEATEYTIYNLLGEVIVSDITNGTYFKIPSSVPAGNYLLKIMLDGNSYYKKMVLTD
ncbi:MAG TPA: T9SS type A sorting domain-containing protein [Chitinophagales bacterium]|nr:T9SS type A sorting domain-containing protein [Chitinophagales bacterium]